MAAALVGLCLVAAAGVVLIATPPSPRSITPSIDIRKFGSRAVVSIGGAAAVLLLSGWLLPSVVMGFGTFWLVGLWRSRKGSNDIEITRLDALASWIENVRDVLMAGEQPIGAITSTVGACGPSIRPEIRRLAAGLNRQDPELVFRRFADELDDPLGDLVATGLAIAIRRGARTVPVLTALAEQTRQQVDRRRLVEAERAPTRREVQALTVIMGGLLVGLLVFGRSQYLDAYDTTGGQLFLAVSLGGYMALIARVQQLAAFPKPGRFLTARQPSPTMGTAS